VRGRLGTVGPGSVRLIVIDGHGLTMASLCAQWLIFGLPWVNH
jgi:hypothetical protein